MMRARRLKLRGVMALGVMVCGLLFGAVPALAAAPEAPVTREVKEVKATSAVLYGALNPLAVLPETDEEYDFAYAQSSGCDGERYLPERPDPALAEPAFLATGAPKESVSGEVTGLQPDREYTYCVIAIHHALGEAPEEAQASNSWTFKTLAIAPEVVHASEKASGETPFEATLHAEVNANNQETTVYFQYSTSNALNGESLASPTDLPAAPGSSIGAGFGPSNVEYGTGQALTPKTVYYYQAVAVNATGTTYGAVEHFQTSSLAPPVVEHESEHASSVTSTGATLEAQINADYQTTSYKFEYSTTEAAKQLTGAIVTIKGASSLAAVGGAQLASVPTGTLLAGTTYYYRVVAENGTAPATDGPVTSFTTVPVPTMGTIENITATTVTFNGHLAPLNENVPTKYSFEYNVGPSCSGPRSPEEEAGTGKGTTAAATANVTELQPNAEYSVCLVAINEFGTVTSAPISFKTLAEAPTIEVGSEKASSVTPFEAILEAQVNPNNQATTYSFQYSTTEALGKLTGTIITIDGSSALSATFGNQTASVSTAGHALEQAKTYHFRVIAENAAHEKTEGAGEFTTGTPEAPLIESESVGAVTPESEAVSGNTPVGATLRAQLNPKYQEASYEFEYTAEESVLLEGKGTKVAGGMLPAGTIAAGIAGHAVSAGITGLAPDTKYFYRVVAHNAAGQAEQIPAVQSFTTTTVPRVSQGGSSRVSLTSATVSGTVYPDGLPTTYYVEYGGAGYGTETPAFQAGAGTGPVPVEVSLSGLVPDNTYHYRIVATNLNLLSCGEIIDSGERSRCQSEFNRTGTYSTPQPAYGEDQTFTTSSPAFTPPILSGVSVSGVTQSTATITGTLDPQSLPTRWELQLGSTPGLLQPIGSGETSSTTPLTLTVGSLSPDTTYYYKLVATNASGTVEPEGSFTTAPGPAAATPSGLPALIPYQSIAELNAKEAREAKGIPNPIITKTLTKAEKLKKALKSCRKEKSTAKRASCEATAKKKYGSSKQKRKK